MVADKKFMKEENWSMIRKLFMTILLFPLFLTAETIIVKTKAPQNRNAVFHHIQFDGEILEQILNGTYISNECVINY